MKIFLFDLSWTLLFPKGSGYSGKLNDLYQQLKSESSFSFWDKYEINEPLVQFIKEQLSPEYTYIFTSGTIQEDPELATVLLPLFSKIYTPWEFGLSKSDPEVYSVLAETIGCDITDMVFVDDSETNIEVAQSVGVLAVQYTSVDVVIEQICNITMNP